MKAKYNNVLSIYRVSSHFVMSFSCLFMSFRVFSHFSMTPNKRSTFSDKRGKETPYGFSASYQRLRSAIFSLNTPPPPPKKKKKKKKKKNKKTKKKKKQHFNNQHHERKIESVYPLGPIRCLWHKKQSKKKKQHHGGFHL